MPRLYSPKHYHCGDLTCACEKTMAGERLAMSRCAGKHFMLAPKLGRHTTSAVSRYQTRVAPTFFYHASRPLTFLQRPDF